MAKTFKNFLKFERKGLGKHESFWLILLLIILITPAFFRLARPGYFYMQDDLQAFRIHQMNECFKDLQIPCHWVPDAGYGYGYPQFIFYAPGVYYLGEVFHILGLQYIDSVKTLFVLGYIFSAVAMYILVNSLLGKWPALVSAVVYTYVPYKAVEVYVRGALSEFWAFTFFPLIFWAFYRYIVTQKSKYFAFASIFTFALLVTHNLMPLIFFPLIVLWCLFWLWQEKKLKMLPSVFLAGLLGFGLSAFFTLPLLLEKRYVHSESLLGGYFDYRQHFVNIKNLFLDMRWGYGSSGFPDEILNLSTGIPQWLSGLAALGLAFAAFKRRKKNKKITLLTFLLVATTLAVLFMIHQKSSFIWNLIPFLAWLQFPWRFLSLSVFLFAILGGLAAYLSKKYSRLTGVILIVFSIFLYASFFRSKNWFYTTDADKFSGKSWTKQQTISIFDYTPIYAKLPPPSRAPEIPEVLEGRADFINYQKASNYQEGLVDVKEKAVIRLPIFDFPGMKVYVDNNLVAHKNDDCRGEIYCLGLVSFNLAEGRHKIRVQLENTPIRMLGNAVSLISVLGVVFTFQAKKKHEENW
jgi:4-amino-4-deoxy-L-arabinose transferase-like glycosyltransferase